MEPAESVRAALSRKSIVAVALLASLALVPGVAEAKVGHIPRGGKVLSFARQPTSVSAEGSLLAWTRRTHCQAGSRRCYRGLVRFRSKTVAVPGALAGADIDLGRASTGNVVATYVRCPPLGCSAFSFDPATRAETRLPLALTPGCRPAAPRIAAASVAYVQGGTNCSAPGLFVADLSTGAVTWKAPKTGRDPEVANADELVGNDLYWSTTPASYAEPRTESDRLYRGRLDTRAYAPIDRGTTFADYSFQSLSVNNGRLFYLLSFSGDEQGASVSIRYRTISGPVRNCRIKGLGTDFDPHSPRSFLLGLAARGPYLYVALTREDSGRKRHPNQLVRYRLRSLKEDCSRSG